MTKLTKPYKDMSADEWLAADESRYGNRDPKTARAAQLIREQRDTIAQLRRELGRVAGDELPDVCELLRKQA